MPGCHASARDGPPFAYRILRAVAARSAFGLEGFDGSGRAVTFDTPDPEWVSDSERCLYWRFDSGVMPAGSPLGPAHRTVWDVARSEIVRLTPRHASQWERRHEEQTS